MIVLDQHPDRQTSIHVLLAHPSALAIMLGFSPQLLHQWSHTSVRSVLLIHVAEDKFISISSRLSGSWQVRTVLMPCPVPTGKPFQRQGGSQASWIPKEGIGFKFGFQQSPEGVQLTLTVPPEG